MPFFAPDVMFLSVMPLTVVMVLSVEFWWNSFSSPLWVGESCSLLSFFSSGVISSEALGFQYFFGVNSRFYVSCFYSSSSRFSVLGGSSVTGVNVDGILPVAGSWEVIGLG